MGSPAAGAGIMSHRKRVLLSARRSVRKARSAVERIPDEIMGVSGSEAALAGRMGSKRIEGVVWHRSSGWWMLWHTFRSELGADSGAFLDLGCGAGRSLVLAARFPVTRVIGVEFEPTVAELARRNVERARWTRGRSIEVVETDVSEYPVPTDVGVVYMFNPFWGDVMQAAMQRVIESYDENPRPLKIVYTFPSAESVLLETGRIVPVRRHRRRRPMRRWAAMQSTTVYEVVPAPAGAAG